MIYKKKSPLLVFLIPAFLFLAVYLYYPFVQTIANTFLNISGLGRQATGVNHPAFANYQRLVSDPELAAALKNSLLLIVCTVVFQVGIALGLALLVASIRQGAKIFQTIYFFPIVISATALGLMFNMIFLYKGGMVNQLLLHLGSSPTTSSPAAKCWWNGWTGRTKIITCSPCSCRCSGSMWASIL